MSNLKCVAFAGKQIIHPNQVAIVQEAFKPSKERLQWAKGLIKAFDEHQARGEVRTSFLLRGSQLKVFLVCFRGLLRLRGL